MDDDLLATCLRELDNDDNVVDYDLPDEDIASLMEVLHAADSRTDTSPQTKKKRNRKRAAHELVYLRDQVLEYTRRLGDLQARTLPRSPESWVWQERSLRQACERKSAEDENVALKDLLQRQVKVAESLMKIVSKRPRLAEMTYLDKWTQSSRTLVVDPVERRDMFHRLLDGQYSRLENVLIAQRLLDSCEAVTKTEVSYDEHSCDIVFDFVVTDVAAVDYLECARVLWSMYGDAYETEFDRTESLDENAMLVKMLLKFRKFGLVVHQHMGCKRYFEHNRVVMVFDSILDDPIHPYPPGVYVARETLTVTREGDNKCSMQFYCHGSLPCKSSSTERMEDEADDVDGVRTMAFAEHMMDCYKRSLDLLGLYLHGQLKLLPTPHDPSQAMELA
ncbi:hypothetical protein DYB36_002457 [Aphanomyces astaci]|uniref:Uncharacterized protein n=1 Tax=Aphanomyces astaci TaxID=112090 RepID=A0A397ALI8_APHAT|nr:hypothetical protein DYB36_002457 [Aphanomyces astaci]